MNKTYVMGYKPEKNMIQNIVSEAFFVTDLAHIKHYENYTFYTNKKDISSYEQLFMVTKNFKKYTFSILKDYNSRYVVSKTFLNLLQKFNVIINKIIPLIVVDHKNHENQINNQFFYIEIENVSYKNAVDLPNSDLKFVYENEIEEINSIKISPNFNSDFYLINELTSKLKTPFCSEKFKTECESINLKGIKFYDLDNTPWMKGDIMDNYFNTLFGNQGETLQTL